MSFIILRQFRQRAALQLPALLLLWVGAPARLWECYPRQDKALFTPHQQLQCPHCRANHQSATENSIPALKPEGFQELAVQGSSHPLPSLSGWIKPHQLQQKCLILGRFISGHAQILITNRRTRLSFEQFRHQESQPMLIRASLISDI